MRRFLLILIWLLILPVSAQEPDPVLTQLRVLFVINADDTITATYQIAMRGETAAPQDISLTLPIPGMVKEVSLVNTHIFDLLDRKTINAPDNLPNVPPCDLSPMLVFGHSGEGAYTPYLKVQAHVSNNQIIDTPTGQAVQVDYRLQQRVLEDSEDNIGTVLHETLPVQITYQPDDSILTLPLDAYLPLLSIAGYHVHLDAYVIAKTPYTVADVPLVEIDPSVLRHPTNQITQTLRDTVGGAPETNLREQYLQKVSAVFNQADSLVFFRPFAATITASELLADEGDELRPERLALADLLAERPYITRLHTEHSLTAVPDLHFVPAPETPDIRTAVAAAVDPVYYYGCTTENLYDAELESQIPAERIYLQLLRTYVPIPDGWKLFEFLNPREPDAPLYAVAPATLTEDQALYHARGYANHITAPALSLGRFRVPYVGEFEPTPEISPDFLTYFSYASPQSFLPVAGNGFIWYWPHPDTAPVDLNAGYSEEPAYAHGVKMRMVAPVDDYIVHADDYDNLLRYLSRYQFFTHPDLRHTLFLGSLGGHSQIGYPEGWFTTNADARIGRLRERLILPQGDVNPATQPYIRILSVGTEELGSTLWRLYGIDQADLESPYDTPFAFEAVNRRGFMRFGANSFGAFLIEFSAPTEDYEQFETLLRTMAEAMRSQRFTEAQS